MGGLIRYKTLSSLLTLLRQDPVSTYIRYFADSPPHLHNHIQLHGVVPVISLTQSLQHPPRHDSFSTIQYRPNNHHVFIPFDISLPPATHPAAPRGDIHGHRGRRPALEPHGGDPSIRVSGAHRDIAACAGGLQGLRRPQHVFRLGHLDLLLAGQTGGRRHRPRPAVLRRRRRRLGLLARGCAAHRVHESSRWRPRRWMGHLGPDAEV